MKKLNVSEQYEKYRNWYFNQQDKVLRQGGAMYSPLYNMKQFAQAYNETKQELKDLVAEGKRTGVGNVYQYMVREQAYPMDQKMYRGLRELYKEAGEKINFNRFTTYEEIRYTAPDIIWDTIQQYYEQLRVDGLNSTSAKALIAQMFFGSD